MLNQSNSFLGQEVSTTDNSHGIPSLHREILDYKKTKSIGKRLVKYVATRGSLPPQKVLYRGDCCYRSMLKLGSIFTFGNPVTSFTTNLGIAKRFSNIENAPDWYTQEKEWCDDTRPWMYKEAVENYEDLIPVIFIIEDCRNVQGMDLTSLNYMFDEDEFIVYTDHVEFMIYSIDHNYVYLCKCN